jgi:hypothetical protein
MSSCRWIAAFALTGAASPAVAQYCSPSYPNYNFCVQQEQWRKDEEDGKRKAVDEEHEQQRQRDQDAEAQRRSASQQAGQAGQAAYSFMVKRTSSRRCNSSWPPRSPIRPTRGSTFISRTRTAGSAWMPKRTRPQCARSNWTRTPSRFFADPIAENCARLQLWVVASTGRGATDYQAGVDVSAETSGCGQEQTVAATRA